ncbi:hypothetical protein BDK51DRAFT_36840 [Blyttiomyces helicus]|uniref:Uncharacterized protein n=1 Tax=Blyttiomyces helicus TaxID=388810 RepID=A0A4P9WMV5_9FUNG|nr:hypothetical protein BDK51DRAFT_36840 [Blyttiomyces helicus]|eukprot:RKO92530.1 hypothetical protein BDK51DRAFT_36840 [Blyttiomyces helicus]
MFFNCALFEAKWEPEEVDVDDNPPGAIEPGARSVAPPGRWRGRLVTACRVLVSTTTQTTVGCLVNWSSMLILLFRDLLVDDGRSTTALLITLAWTPVRLRFSYGTMFSWGLGVTYAVAKNFRFLNQFQEDFFELRAAHLYTWMFLYFSGSPRKDIEYFMALSTPSWTWFLLSLAAILGSEFLSSGYWLMKQRASFQAYHQKLEDFPSVSTPHSSSILQTRTMMHRKSIRLTPFDLSAHSSVPSRIGVESGKNIEVSPWEHSPVVPPFTLHTVGSDASSPATAAAAVAAVVTAGAHTDLLETFRTHALLNRFRLASKMAAALAACSWYAVFCSTEVLESVAGIGNLEANLVFQPPGSYPEEASWNEVTLRIFLVIALTAIMSVAVLSLELHMLARPVPGLGPQSWLWISAFCSMAFCRYCQFLVIWMVRRNPQWS